MNIEVLKQKLDDHLESDRRRFNGYDKNFMILRNEIDDLKNNHIQHLQKDVGELKVRMGEVKNDVGWLKKFFWIVAASSVAGLITGLINLLINTNGKL